MIPKLKKGRHKWCPASVIDELDDIKREEDIKSDAQAFTKMVKYTRVGREARRLVTLDFSKAIRRPPVDAYPAKSRKRYKKVRKRR